jgi:hypothetical protein
MVGTGVGTKHLPAFIPLRRRQIRA